jgi:hypothetical protein
MTPTDSRLPLRMIRPFGPSIVKVRLPDIIVNQLNQYVDAIIQDESKASKLDHGNQLAGNVYQELLLETEFLKQLKWVEFLGYVCSEWLKITSGKELKNLELINSWIVRQFKNEYNPTHHHSGHISGVGYLKVPQNMGSTVQDNKRNNQNGKLVFIHGSASWFSDATFEITPEVGDFYMFPNYLQHVVYPFRDTEEERRSISFNAKLDDAAVTY